MSEEIIKEFKEQSIYRINESTRMISIAIKDLTDEEMWLRPTKTSNSIGNLILHLCGNITQYAISSLGMREDKRDRDAEFQADSNLSKTQLLKKLEEVVLVAKTTIEESATHELMRKRDVQGFHFSGIGIIIHVTEHYSYHTGQIAFWVKQMKRKRDLGFYDGVDLTVKNDDSC